MRFRGEDKNKERLNVLERRSQLWTGGPLVYLSLIRIREFELSISTVSVGPCIDELRNIIWCVRVCLCILSSYFGWFSYFKSIINCPIASHLDTSQTYPDTHFSRIGYQFSLALISVSSRRFMECFVAKLVFVCVCACACWPV